MRPLILVAADDAQLRATLARWLLAAGYAVELAESAKRAREVAADQPVALAIVDPGGFGDAGADLARELGAVTGGLLTIDEMMADAVAVLAGADDQASKPLEQESVLARVQAALPVPASEPERADDGVVRFEGYTLDAGARTCVADDGRDVALTRAEFSLLACLVENAGRVTSRDRLSQATAGRVAGPDDRTVDVLISRVRRKLEANPKEPRLIVTVAGEGYRFAGRVQAVTSDMAAPAAAAPAPVLAVATDAPPVAAAVITPAADAAVSGPARGRRFASPLGWPVMLGSAAVLVAAVLAITLWLPRGGTSVPATEAQTEAPRKFDAAVIPLLDDAARQELASYATQPDYKALALWINGWSVVYGAPSAEAAKAEALRKCRMAAKNTRVCGIYAAGMDVVWPASPPMPLRADLHAEPLDRPFVAEQLVHLDEEARNTVVDGYMRLGDHKALAVTATGQAWSTYNRASVAEVARLTVERCGEAFGVPCLLVSINNKLTIEIPKSRAITGFFLLTTEPGLSEAERARIDHVYQGKDWRALARGAGGGWYPVANAASEQEAVDAALASCAQHDSGCRVYAIGNFRVGDVRPPPSRGMVLSSYGETLLGHRFDASLVPLVSDIDRRQLALYPGHADFKAIAISIDGWGFTFGAPDQARAENDALAQCRIRSTINKNCRLYAVGTNVVWTDQTLALPLAADIHELLDIPLSLAALPMVASVADRQHLEQAIALTGHSAYAIRSVLPLVDFKGGNYADRNEARRVVTERCADYYRGPCLLLAVDGKLTVQVPRTRSVTGVFMLSTEPLMSEADRQRIAQTYWQKDWRALARGGRGGWYPVSGAPSEVAAVEGAMAACTQHESGCRIYAISNFRVADE